MTQKKRIAAARARAAKSNASASQPAAAHPQQGFAPPAQPPLDQSAIISTSGEAQVVPNDRSAHMRQKAAGSGNVRDFDPNRARAQAEQVKDAQVYRAPGARNARPHLPEGNPNVRSQAGNARAAGNRHHAPHVRDAPSAKGRAAGAGNVMPSRSRVQDAPQRVSPGMHIRPAPAPQGYGAPQGQPQPPQGHAAPQGQPQPPQGYGAPAQGFAPQPVPQPPAAAPAPAPQAPAQPTGPQGNVPHAVGPGPQGQPPADLTVILTTFRRPQYLRPQLSALAAQTTRPTDIWMWVNDWGAGGNLHDHEAEAHYTFFRSKVNLGPWVRFSIAAECQSKYLLILDDDCFPGPKWIESAVARLEQMESQGELAVVCAEGRVFGADDPHSFAEVGPSDPPPEDALVDEGAKAWLVPRALLELINGFPRAPTPVGWGLHVGAALSAHGYFQLVLGYTEEDKSNWGSLPVGATPEQPGTALSTMLPGYADARAAAWSFYRSPEIGGWTPIALQAAEDSPAGDQPSDDEPVAEAPADDKADDAAAKVTADSAADTDQD